MNNTSNRSLFEELLKRRFFYGPAFNIYGGVKGFYDYGPPGTAVKNNLLQFWRQFYILEEDLLEIDTTSITPEAVFKASGHVERFQDIMVRDIVTGECVRADHLLEQFVEQKLENAEFSNEDEKCQLEKVLAQAGNFNCSELDDAFEKYQVKFPETGNQLVKSFPFNLMFSTSIGPTGKEKGYLRPEIAQGIFLNFKRLLEYNFNRLPFGGCHIGSAFRNEISPRTGLLRVREFTLAEIEYFHHPKSKTFSKFAAYKSYEMNFYPRTSQLDDQKIQRMTIGQAVEKGIVANEILGYFLVRTQIFLHRVGILPDKLRFRQHLGNEMAHYACDCWDAEIQVSYGWIECVGHADRSCYDLSVHSKATGESLGAFCEYPDGPRVVDMVEIVIDKATLGKNLRNSAKSVLAELDNINNNPSAALQCQQEMERNGFVVVSGQNLDASVLKFNQVQLRVAGETVIPAVVEPSFGIGRILYCILEHAYKVREDDEQRAFLSLQPIIAPLKVSVLPLMSKKELLDQIPMIMRCLIDKGIMSKVDDSTASIGKRYARTDEIGTPFSITIDYTTLDDNTITLRERDSTRQVRVPISEIPSLLLQLISQEIHWKDVCKRHPTVPSSTVI